ncbi:hypothetical protein CYJ76_12020, partial [Kytococcus schroeteri]
MFDVVVCIRAGGGGRAAGVRWPGRWRWGGAHRGGRVGCGGGRPGGDAGRGGGLPRRGRPGPRRGHPGVRA